MSTDQELITQDQTIASINLMGDVGLPPRYQLQGLVGHGGMGEVYRALDADLGRLVAIKVLHVELAQSHESHQRFLREAQTLAALTHANILKIHSFGVTSRLCRPYQVTDYLVGESLSDFLHRNGPLSTEQFRTIFVGILEALRVYSAQGIVHRDLKPSNIFLCGSAESIHPILLDFGIACFEDGGQAKTLTATSSVLGSPAYMSPEQCRGEKVSFASDIYSLGCVMYEALSGRAPFVGETAMETMYMHMSAAVPKLDAYVSNEPVLLTLCNLVQQCLDKEPNRRPATANELLEQLIKALDETPDSVRFGAQRIDAVKRSLARRFLPLLCTFLLLGACGALFLSMYKDQRLKAEANSLLAKDDRALLHALRKRVARAQSALDHCDKANKDEYVRSVWCLKRHLDEVKNWHSARVECEETILVVHRISDLMALVNHDKTIDIELQLDLFNHKRELAWRSSDQAKPKVLRKEAATHMKTAESLLAPDDKIGIVRIVTYKAIELAEEGRFEEANKLFDKVQPVYEKITAASILLSMAVAEEPSDWRPTWWREVLRHLTDRTRCTSAADALQLARLIGVAGRNLDGVHDADGLKSAQRSLRQLLTRWFATPPVDEEDLKTYKACLAQSMKTPSHENTTDVEYMLNGLGKRTRR